MTKKLHGGTILDAADSTPVEAWLQRLMCGEFDDLILLTGEGLRRLLALGERLGTRSEVVAAISRLRTIVRGPKPARVLRENRIVAESDCDIASLGRRRGNLV